MDQLLLDLFQAYYDARRNKRNTINQLRFEIDYEHELFRLHDEILSESYTIGKSICFVVNNPVKREIFAADFRDRIVHHLLFNYMNPVVDTQFIDDSYSCRTGRGTLFGVKRMAEFVRLCSCDYTQDCYVMKLDIKGYFMSMNKHLLGEKLRKMIEPYRYRPVTDTEDSLCWNDRFDFDLFWRLIDQVVWNDPTRSCIVKCRRLEWNGLPPSKSLFHARPDCGLPIGNLTSQVFSNVYLHDFDQYIKNEIDAVYYGRYVDDFVLIHPDKSFLLETLKKIKAVLKERFLLELHPDKIYLQHYTRGFLFLGAYIKPQRIYIGNRTKKQFKAMVSKIEKQLETTVPSRKDTEDIRASVNSYLGLTGHYRSYNIRRKILLHRVPALSLLKYGHLRVKPYQSMIYCLKFLLLFALFAQVSHAQTVRIECPAYPEKEVALTLKYGIKNDTVYSGKLDVRGTAGIAIPETYAGYAGMATLTIDRNLSLNLIINGENPVVRGQMEESVEIAESPENTALQAWMNEQTFLWQKIAWLNEAGRLYRPADPFYSALKQEKQALQILDTGFDKKLNNNPLYAAQWMKFYRFLNREVHFLAEADSVGRAQARTFVRDSLDAEQLYTSGLWFEVLNGLLALYDEQSPDHALFVEDMKPVLNRIRSNRIHTGMLEDLFAICESVGWSGLEEELSYFAINDERIVNPTGRLQALKNIFKLAKGSPAPALSGSEVSPCNTLLFFYESGCGHCRIEAGELIEQYVLLKQSGYDVISFSADENRQVFEETAASFPWSGQRYDGRGFEGEDFKHYGVTGTPTFYLIDEKGIILGRYARVKDICFIKNHK
jgi:hypothetical protein